MPTTRRGLHNWELTRQLREATAAAELDSAPRPFRSVPSFGLVRVSSIQAVAAVSATAGVTRSATASIRAPSRTSRQRIANRRSVRRRSS